MTYFLTGSGLRFTERRGTLHGYDDKLAKMAHPNDQAGLSNCFFAVQICVGEEFIFFVLRHGKTEWDIVWLDLTSAYSI